MTHKWMGLMDRYYKTHGTNFRFDLKFSRKFQVKSEIRGHIYSNSCVLLNFRTKEYHKYRPSAIKVDVNVTHVDVSLTCVTHA